MTEKQHENVSITMSVSGIRNLVCWLDELDRNRKELNMTWEEDEKKTFDDYVGFLKDVLQGRENQI